MPRRFASNVVTFRTAAAVSALAAFAVFGGMSACSKKVQEETTTTVETTVAEASAGISSVAADMDTQKTQDFVQKAAVANLFEIQTSQLAQEKSKSKAVLAFADQMIDDHGKAAVAFEAAVAKAGLTSTGVVDDDHQKKIDDLKAKTGADFDKAYIDVQKAAHDDAVNLFDDYSKNGKAPSLQTFATETLPTLKMHQDKITTLKP